MRERFTGISKNGDLQEAIRDAVRSAKDGLKTSYVIWELESLRGEYGGIVDVEILEVVLLARAPE